MEKVFKNGPRKISGRQPLKNFKEYGRPYPSNILKAVFHKFTWSILEYLVPFGKRQRQSFFERVRVFLKVYCLIVKRISVKNIQKADRKKLIKFFSNNGFELSVFRMTKS